MNHRKTIIAAVVAVGLVAPLSGCLVNRVVEVRDQFCEFDANFTIDSQNLTAFDFHNPVLLDSDILWLASATPTEISRTADGLSMLYVIEKVSEVPAPEQDLWLALDFEQSGKKHKLSRIRFDPKLKNLVSPEYLDEDVIQSAAQTVCGYGLGMMSRSVRREIKEEKLELLPSRHEVIDWFGPPLEQDVTSGRMTYEYRLKSPDSEDHSARFSIWYDEQGIIPSRLESQYSRFHTVADFEALEVTMKVDL